MFSSSVLAELKIHDLSVAPCYLLVWHFFRFIYCVLGYTLLISFLLYFFLI